MAKSMVFYEDWLDSAEQFDTEDEQLAYLKGILLYGLRGIKPEDDACLASRLGYNNCKGSIETNNKKRKGGFSGGAPIGNTNAKKVDDEEQPMVDEEQPMVEENQPTINVNVNDNVNGNENLNENENKENTQERVEREVFKKFFFKNFLHPEDETRRYLDWGEGTGWINKSGQPITNKVTYASFWKPKEEGERFPAVAQRILIKAYTLASTGSDCEDAVLSFTEARIDGSQLILIGESEAFPSVPYVQQAAALFGIPVVIKTKKARQ